MSTFYEFRMLNLPARYGLSYIGQTMLKAFEDFKTGHIDETALGRLIRLSPKNRAAIVETIQKCSIVIGEKPKETKYCLVIIQSCTEMLSIAGTTPQPLPI
jgi:hypothetical protein